MDSGRAGETELQRADRNWDELLQELRVTQTGVAILFSALLTLPFSARFGAVTSGQRDVYLTALVLSALTTVTLIAPVAYHRLLFGTGHKAGLVVLGNRLARLGLGLLVLTLVAVLLLVLLVLLEDRLASLSAIAFAAFTAALWFVPALLLRRREADRTP